MERIKQMEGYIMVIKKSVLFLLFSSCIVNLSHTTDMPLDQLVQAVETQGKEITKLSAQFALFTQKTNLIPQSRTSLYDISSLGDAGSWAWENKKPILLIAGGTFTVYTIYSIYHNLMYNVRYEGRTTRSLLRNVKEYLMQLIQTEGKATRKEIRQDMGTILKGVNENRRSLAELQNKPAPADLELPQKQKPTIVEDATPKEENIGFFGRMKRALWG
ncbi:MAG: hypothetical protein WD055_03710 [Candidatus Dependentiae bacterium]